MVTEADWNNQNPEDYYPYPDVVFEAFGTDRLMFGSDWPVCTLAQSYAYVAELLEGYISHLSPAITEKIMGENCSLRYRLQK
jgi:L-fuconolactonase